MEHLLTKLQNMSSGNEAESGASQRYRSNCQRRKEGGVH